MPLPEEKNDQTGPWWEIFDANIDDIQDIVLMILDLYMRPKATYISVTTSSFASEENPINHFWKVRY